MIRRSIIVLAAVVAPFAMVASLTAAATMEETAKQYFDQGAELNKQQHYDEAIAKLTLAVRMSIDTHKYHQALFLTYLATRRGLQGIEAYKGLVHDFPKNAAPHYWLGRFYLESRSLDDAAREFQAATTLAPADEHGWISLGHVYYRQGKDDAALRAYREADHLSPKVAVVHAGLGNLYMKKHEDAQARTEMMTALQLDPSLTETRYNLARIYERAGDTDKAMEQWQQILEDDPNESDARKRLADAYLAQKKYADAVEEFDTLSRINQESPDVFLSLGEAQILLASTVDDTTHRREVLEAATHSLQRVIELDPDNDAAQKYLKQIQSLPGAPQ